MFPYGCRAACSFPIVVIRQIAASCPLTPAQTDLFKVARSLGVNRSGLLFQLSFDGAFSLHVEGAKEDLWFGIICLVPHKPAFREFNFAIYLFLHLLCCSSCLYFFFRCSLCPFLLVFWCFCFLMFRILVLFFSQGGPGVGVWLVLFGVLH